ncbi:hypothetical protein TWF694_005983 [Orbilia ellipsospora]|uniref:Cytochrome P450 n=1 Tax=Orbilia ellipsospora TaxID=2528407 RepID=A0AAV9WT53_9PEZI
MLTSVYKHLADCPERLFSLAGAAVIIYFISSAIYEIYFSPLAKIPGPWYIRVSRFWLISRVATARVATDIESLHEHYGPYVRIGPNEVSISDIESVKKIHSVHDPYLKSRLYKKLGNGLSSLFFIVDPEAYKHRRMAYGNAFSKSNLSLMEPVVRKYVNTCVRKIKQDIDNKGITDMMKWIQAMSTDIIGEISYGQELGMLESENFNSVLQDAVTYTIIIAIRGHFPLWRALESIITHIPHPKVQHTFGCERRILAYGADILENLQPNVQNGKNGKTQQSLFSKILANSKNSRIKHKMTINEIKQEALLVLIAGSHTITIVGTYICWAIFKRRDIRRKLETEFSTLNKDVTDEKLQKLPYFSQVLKEALRLYPAGQIPAPRVVPGGTGGRQLGEYFFPSGTEVLTPIYTIQRDRTIFPDPHSLKPERWNNPTKEMEAAILTFGGASRPCIGQQLAMMELRLLVATLLQSCADVELADSCTDESMEFVEYMSVRPKANKCELRRRTTEKVSD